MLISRKKGLVIVVVLWVVVLLGIITAVAGKNSRLDTRVRATSTRTLRCRWACRAGIDTAIAVLNDDSKGSDSLKDLWSDNEEDFNDIELEGCSFTVKVVDEAGKLNINAASRNQLLKLPYMTEEIADAIIDWRDKNDVSGQAGVEQGYYRNLPYGYEIRNGPFRTIRELLLVKSVTPELLYGEDTNFNGKLDYNEMDGDENPPADDKDNKLDEGWIAYLTCYSYDKNKDANGKKRININKANEKTLTKSLDISKSHAKWIVENRKKKYKSISDLINKKSQKKAKKSSKKKSDEAKPLDLETFSKIADKITITDNKKIKGRVNVNTAPKAVLAALLGGGDEGEQIADDIITYRQGLIGGMDSIAQLLNVDSMKISTFKKIAKYITVRSDVYVVRSFATANENKTGVATLQTEVVMDRTPTPAKVLYWYQGVSN